MTPAPRSLNIKFCLNGIIVTVGCQRVVFNDKEEFLSELRNYLKDPTTMETQWQSRAMFHDSEQPQCGVNPIIPINNYADMDYAARRQADFSALGNQLRNAYSPSQEEKVYT